MPKRSTAGDVALPGLEAALLPMDARPADGDMSDEKVYTAGVLFRDHPRVFKSAVNLLFRNGLSERSVAAALYLSTNTVRAIRDMVTGMHGRTSDPAAAAFFIKSRVSNSRKTLQLRVLEVLADRLDDPDERKKITVESLLEVVKTVEELERPSQAEKNPAKEHEVYDLDADAFDEVMDGLNPEKKSAHEECPAAGPDAVDPALDPVDETGPECSTGDTDHGVRSSSLSASPLINKGETQTLCNSLCNSVESTPQASVDRPISVGTVSEPPSGRTISTPSPGAGGGPGAARAGGVD